LIDELEKLNSFERKLQENRNSSKNGISMNDSTRFGSDPLNI
jgi:hypothetical protein